MSQLKTAISMGYNVIIFSFYNVYSNGSILEDYGSVSTPTKSEIGNSNFIYLVSLFGGETGSAPSVSNPTDWAKSMYQNFLGLKQKFGFDGIDIDLENAWGATPNNVPFFILFYLFFIFYLIIFFYFIFIIFYLF